MAFPTKSGKSYGSAYVAKKKDAMDAEKSAGEPKNNPFAKSSAGAKPAFGGAGEEAKESPEFEKGEAEGAKEAPEAVVAAHGPAHSVTIHHGAGKHKVISHHQGGFMHESEHSDPASAHEEGKTLAGVGQESPEEAQGAGAGMGESQPDGFQMPSLG